MAGKGLLFLLVLIPIYLGTVVCFRGSIYEPTSFQDTGEWDTVYTQTCVGRRQDLFGEPRDNEYPDELKAPQSSKTPIVINTKDVVRSLDNITLHIYNQPGIRGGYSVSYGFQRNKECIHGYDTDCIVSNTFGKIRAVVVNAERFKKGQDLNYIKDHFLVEDPEKFATILNGGSIYERKFYEAVFLGGFLPKALQNRGQSSHQIDGKTYPMEIYMYFVDEAVPAMALTTILVVLVEESDRDNPFVKPIVAAVKNKLYDEERRFLHNNAFLVRQETLFHNQLSSLNYDLTQKTKPGIRRKYQRAYRVKEKSSGASIDIEEALVAQMEKYEKMEALGNALLRLDEDVERASKQYQLYFSRFLGFALRTEPNPSFNFNFDELHMSLILPLLYDDLQHDLVDCRELTMTQHFARYESFLRSNRAYNDTYRKRQINSRVNAERIRALYPEPLGRKLLIKHEKDYADMFYEVCNYIVRLNKWQQKNIDYGANKTKLSFEEKYQHIGEYLNFSKTEGNINRKVYEHFFGEDSLHQIEIDGVREFSPDFVTEASKHEFLELGGNILESIFTYQRYHKAAMELQTLLDTVAQDNGFSGTNEMRDVLYFHKRSKNIEDLETRRYFYYNAFLKHFMPHQSKKRGFAETGGMELPEKDIEAERGRSPLKVKVEQAFQISWLIPNKGGYYHYAGSSPVPPCFRAHNVIVFKQPISMSKHQIEILTRVPITFDRNDDILHTTPVIDETKFRVTLKADKTKGVRYEDVEVPVYNQPRNHLFLGHDGVHKNSVEEYEKNLLKRKIKKEKQQMYSSAFSHLLMLGKTEKVIAPFLPIFITIYHYVY